MSRSKIAGVTLLIPDYDSAIAFYTSILGFKLTSNVDQGDGRRFVTVEPEAGGVRLVLARAESTAEQAAIGQQAGGRVLLFLETDDFICDRAKMEAAGVLFEEATRSEPYGLVAIWRDPFGNRWDLIQPSTN